jgi:hypothetical protein
MSLLGYASVCNCPCDCAADIEPNEELDGRPCDGCLSGVHGGPRSLKGVHHARSVRMLPNGSSDESLAYYWTVCAECHREWPNCGWGV